MKHIFSILLLLACMSSRAQTNINVIWNFPYPIKSASMTLHPAFGIWNTNTLLPNPQCAPITNGQTTVVFTNVITGFLYKMTVGTLYSTTVITNYFPTNLAAGSTNQGNQYTVPFLTPNIIYIVNSGLTNANPNAAILTNTTLQTFAGDIDISGQLTAGDTQLNSLNVPNALKNTANAGTGSRVVFAGADGTFGTPASSSMLSDAATIHAAGSLTGIVAQANGGTGITNSQSLQNWTYVSSVFGSDATGATNDIWHPFKTPFAAKTAVAAGGNIWVLPGFYTNNDLAKDHVNWYWCAGTTNLYTGGNSGYQVTNGYAIFDDHDSAMTFSVLGQGTFIWGNLTGGLSGDLPSTSPYTGILKTQNAGTIVHFVCDKLQGGGPSCTLSVGYMGAIWCQDCKSMIVVANEIGQVSNTNDEEWSGIGWVHGDCHVTVNGPIDVSEGPAIQDTGAFIGESSVETQLYVKATEIFATNSSGDDGTIAIFSAGASDGVNNFNSKSRVWIDCPHIAGNSSVVGGGMLQFVGGAYNYITTLKVDDKGVFNTLQVGSVNGLNTGIVWLTSEKVSSKSSWLAQNSGVSHLHVSNWEDQGGMTNGWQFLSGGNTYSAWIEGGSAVITNGNGILFQGGGAAIFKDVNIDTSQTVRTTNNCAIVSGSGLQLQACVMHSPPGEISINASTSQTVLALATCVTTNASANITFSPANQVFTNSSFR